MRWCAALLLVPFLARAAAAHGGSGFRGPGGGVPPGLLQDAVQRGIPCDCGLAECDKCSSEALRRGDEVNVSPPVVMLTKRWGDVARCRIEVTLETSRDRGMVEAYARIEPGPLFAAVAGSFRNGSETLSADLGPSEEARRKYLYARRLFNFDPMLVLRRGAGRIDVRAYPLRKGEKAVLVLEGYLLVDAPEPEPVRLYRTGDRFLAIVALGRDEHPDRAAFRAGRSGRSLHFLSRAECRERFGTDAAEEVPFVPALESAVTGKGDRAASDSTALIALADGSPEPPFVGPDRPLPPAAPVLREPADPGPPPPPRNPG